MWKFRFVSFWCAMDQRAKIPERFAGNLPGQRSHRNEFSAFDGWLVDQAPCNARRPLAEVGLLGPTRRLFYGQSHLPSGGISVRKPSNSSDRLRISRSHQRGRRSSASRPPKMNSHAFHRWQAFRAICTSKMRSEQRGTGSYLQVHNQPFQVYKSKLKSDINRNCVLPSTWSAGGSELQAVHCRGLQHTFRSSPHKCVTSLVQDSLRISRKKNK